MTQRNTPLVKASVQTLKVLDVLLRHFATGMTNQDIARAAGLTFSGTTRHVATLIACGFAERIPETDRIRPSTRMGQAAVSILKSLDDASSRLDELKGRVTRAF